MGSLPVKSTVSALAERIRQDILDGVFAPGELLTQREVSARYGVSRIPLREALRQLEAERWVIYEPNRGAFVSSITSTDIREMFAVRRILETGAIRLVAKSVTPAVLQEARSIDSAMRRAKGGAAIISRHNEFHEVLYGSIGNARLLETITSHRIRVQRLPDPDKRMMEILRATRDDHRALLAACGAGDARAAERAVLTELGHLEAIMLAALG
jgi:DNA-binding GntR family transcriptional regulator